MPFSLGKKHLKSQNQGLKSLHIAQDRKRKAEKHKSPISKKEKRSLDHDMIAISQKQRKLYIATAFVLRYKHPPQLEWDDCALILARETEMDVRTIKSTFQAIDMHKNVDIALQEREKSGRPPKLTKDNAGLVAAAAALNLGVSPQQAVYVCNAVNKKTV
jgi:hypothetical protein